MKSAKTILLLGIMTFGLSACYLKHSEPYFTYAPDMHYNPSLKAQEEGAMRQPVKGTIPFGFRPYSIESMDQAKALQNPLPKTKPVLQKGRQLYNVYCIVCHGPNGEGDGTVAAMENWPRPLFPRPPTLQSDKIRDMKDGQLFHIITMGQNLMPSYAEKLNEEERWSIALYLRALYRSKHPTADDLKKAANYVEDNL